MSKDCGHDSMAGNRKTQFLDKPEGGGRRSDRRVRPGVRDSDFNMKASTCSLVYLGQVTGRGIEMDGHGGKVGGIAHPVEPPRTLLE